MHPYEFRSVELESAGLRSETFDTCQEEACAEGPPTRVNVYESNYDHIRSRAVAMKGDVLSTGNSCSIFLAPRALSCSASPPQVQRAESPRLKAPCLESNPSPTAHCPYSDLTPGTFSCAARGNVVRACLSELCRVRLSSHSSRAITRCARRACSTFARARFEFRSVSPAPVAVPCVLRGALRRRTRRASCARRRQRFNAPTSCVGQRQRQAGGSLCEYMGRER